MKKPRCPKCHSLIVRRLGRATVESGWDAAKQRSEFSEDVRVFRCDKCETNFYYNESTQSSSKGN